MASSVLVPAPTASFPCFLFSSIHKLNDIPRGKRAPRKICNCVFCKLDDVEPLCKVATLQTPMSVALRVNTACSSITPKVAVDMLKNGFFEPVQPLPSLMPETVCLPVKPVRNESVLATESLISQYPFAVIVGRLCGESIISGADAFAPGIAAWPVAISSDSDISVRVYADTTDRLLRGACTRYGDRPSIDSNVYLGIGSLEKRSRKEVFDKNASGIAVRMTLRVWEAPPLAKVESIFPEAGSIVLQTFPSQIVSRVVSPQIDDHVLDMCAAPGGKTAHLAALQVHSSSIEMVSGSITAIARTKRKKAVIEQKLTSLRVLPRMKDTVKIVIGDACTALDMFGTSAFDKVLLDAPCTGAGTRPRLLCYEGKMRGGDSGLCGAAHEESLQKQLLFVASRVVRVGGEVVYSVCSNRKAEGQDMVNWVLSQRDSMGLELIRAIPLSSEIKQYFDGAWQIADRSGKLSSSDLRDCISFDATDSWDKYNVHTGFFIAKFRRSI